MLSFLVCHKVYKVIKVTMIYFQIERRGRSEEKRSSWQPYRVALSDEASGDAGDAHGEAEDDDDEAVYGKPIKYTYANTNKNSKDNKWSNRRAGNSSPN
jgi:hypothetical protein